MKKLKLLHIMPMGSLIFNDVVIKMINNNKNEFSDIHSFFLTSQNSYNVSKHYSNVYLKEGYLDSRLKNIKADAKKYDFIIMHSNPLTIKQHLYLDKDTAKKIIWIIWGHDLYNKKIPILKDFTLIKKIRRTVFHFLFDLITVPKVRMFEAIGIGFPYDSLEINKLYGNQINIIKAPYGTGSNISSINEAIRDSTICNDLSKPTKIMIGNSAIPLLNHMEILDKLKTYRNENIIISIPISYGSEEYRISVKNKASEIFRNKVEFLEGFMPQLDHVKYINSVDIAIIDSIQAAALGNIYLLLYMKKKIYLNSHGIMYKAFFDQNINVNTTDSIGIIAFQDFINNNKVDTKGSEFGLSLIDDTIIIQNWKDLFQGLERKKHE